MVFIVCPLFLFLLYLRLCLCLNLGDQVFDLDEWHIPQRGEDAVDFVQVKFQFDHFASSAASLAVRSWIIIVSGTTALSYITPAGDPSLSY